MRPRYWVLLLLLVCAAGCGDRDPMLECPVCDVHFRYADRGESAMGWTTKIYLNEDCELVAYDSKSVCSRTECLVAADQHNVELVTARILDIEEQREVEAFSVEVEETMIFWITQDGEIWLRGELLATDAALGEGITVAGERWLGNWDEVNQQLAAMIDEAK